MFCKKCGNRLDSDYAFCSRCGTSVNVQSEEKASGSMFYMAGDLASSSNRRETTAFMPEIGFENQKKNISTEKCVPSPTSARNNATTALKQNAPYIPKTAADRKPGKISFIKENLRIFLVGGCVVALAVVLVIVCATLFSNSHAARTPEEAIERYIKAYAEIDIREMYECEGIELEQIMKEQLKERMNEFVNPSIENLKELLKSDMDDIFYFEDIESGEWYSRLQKAATLDELATFCVDFYVEIYQNVSIEDKMSVQEKAKEMLEELQSEGVEKLQDSKRQKALDRIEDGINSGPNGHLLNALPYTIDDIGDIYIFDGDIAVVETSKGFYVARTAYSNCIIAW